MDVTELIRAIQFRRSQPTDLLKQFVLGVANGDVPHDQATKWLKAVHQHGCTTEDKVILTQMMAQSGSMLSWNKGPPVVDKHSTGGVGDKMSLMLAPALAACGCRVPMLAGRGLGHTGGTIDKLESIPGFNCRLTPEEMSIAVERVGCCIAVQNDAIAPADGVLYALRDVTNTIDSVPLITASIISKKAAEGLQALVLDVKVGQAAFMKTLEQARELASSMVETANGMGIHTKAQITSMDNPIGSHVGNALEVIESVEVLKGGGSKDTRNLVVLQGSALLSMTLGLTDKEATKRMEEVLDNGSALRVFEQMCIEQGVDEEVAAELLHDPEAVVGRARHQTDITAPETCVVQSIDAMAMAELARAHGAGRFELEDIIDPHVGFVVHCSPGQHVEQGAVLLTFHHNRSLAENEQNQLEMVVLGSNTPLEPKPRLVETIELGSTKP